MTDREQRGRLLALDAAQGEILLALEGRSTHHRCAPTIALDVFRPGDWVAARFERETISALRILTPYRREVPFPSPGGDYLRLRSGSPARAQRLQQRATLLRAIREFFHSSSYLEIEPPLRVRHPGLEPHLVVEAAGEGLSLITSPEYQMKRLLAAGFERIYALCKCWRGDEVGRHHLPEFTMLEWYRAHADIYELMDETEALLRACAEALQRPCPPRFSRLSVAMAFSEQAGVDIAGVTDAPELARRARAAGISAESDEGFEEIFSRILVERVEPALAARGAVFLYHYPAPLAALSRLSAADATIAERFELYFDGVELANAFGELTDAKEQRRRLEADRAQRASRGAPSFAIDEAFIEALKEGIPPSAGIALGVDRLLMALVGESDIRNTVAFAADEL